MKKEAKIRPFWYSDVWLFPKLITIVTTLDEDGKVNAAPYSHIMQYDVMPKNPRIMVGMRQSSHTLREHPEDRRVRHQLPESGRISMT